MTRVLVILTVTKLTVHRPGMESTFDCTVGAIIARTKRKTIITVKRININCVITLHTLLVNALKSRGCNTEP